MYRIQFMHLVQLGGLLRNKACSRESIITQPYSVKSQLNASAKKINPGQPVQFAQADLGRKFLVSVNFLYVKGRVYLLIHTVVEQNRFYRSQLCDVLLGKVYCTHAVSPLSQAHLYNTFKFILFYGVKLLQNSITYYILNR